MNETIAPNGNGSPDHNGHGHGHALDDLVDLPVRAIAWTRFHDELLDAYAPGLCAPATRKGMVYMLRVIEALRFEATAEHPEGLPCLTTTADLNLKLLARILATRPAHHSPSTVRGLLRCVRVACNTAVESGYLRVSPFARRPLSRLVPAAPPNGDKRHLSREELHRLLELLEGDVANSVGWRQWKARRLQAMIAMVIFAGLRRNELLYLHVADVDLNARALYVRSRADRRVKTSASEDDLPICKRLAVILTTWLDHRLDAPPGFNMPPDGGVYLFPGARRGGPWTGGPKGQKPLDRLQAAAVRAGIPGGCTWQMLRRSCATHLEFFGLTGDEIRRILRHTTELTGLKHYRMTDLDNLREKMDGIDF